MLSHPRKALFLSLFAGVFVAPCLATNFSWTPVAAVDQYDDAANWSPAGGPPGAGDQARFISSGTYEVIFPAFTDNEADELQVQKGNYTLRSTSSNGARYELLNPFGVNTVYETNLTLGSYNAFQQLNMTLAGDLRVDAGSTVNLGPSSAINGEDLFLGVTFGGVNTINVDSFASRFNLTGNAILGSNGGTANLHYSDLARGTIEGDTVLINFNSTPGTEAYLTVDSEATITTAGIAVGQSTSTTAEQTAILKVDGVGSTLTQTGASGVTIGVDNNPNLDSQIHIFNGGVFTTGTGNTRLRRTGRLRVLGEGSTYNANGPMIIEFDAFMIINNGGTLNANAGLDNSVNSGSLGLVEGTVKVTNGAFIPNAGGDFTINGDSLGDGSNLILGAGSTTDIDGTFAFAHIRPGHLTVEGGATLTTQSFELGGNASSISSMDATVDGPGTTWDNAGLFYFGHAATTDFTVSNQAVVTTAVTDLSIGTARVESMGEWTTTGLFSADDNATVEVDGGRLTTGDANIGDTAGFVTGMPTVVSVSGGGQWHSTGEMRIGGNDTGTGGETSFTAHSGGTVEINGDTVLWSPGTFTMQAGSTVDFDGELVDQGGVFSFDGGQLNLNDPANGLTVDLSGLHTGTLDLNATTLDADRGISVAGATFVAPGATLTVDGGSAELSRLTVSTGSAVSFTGGTLSARGPVQAATGSVIDIDGGEAALGDSRAVNGVYIGGELHAHANAVRLLDANDAVLDSGALVTLGEGASQGGLLADNGLTLDFGGNITGYGTVVTPNDPAKPLINNGHIRGESKSRLISLEGYVKGVGTLDNVKINGTDAPGFSPADVVRGTVVYAGELEIEIGGLIPGAEHDRVNHVLGEGAAALGGDLVVDLIGGFENGVALSDTFTVLTAESLSGEFANAPDGGRVNLADGPGSFRIDYDTGAGTVTLSRFQSTPFFPGDYNADGVVDAADYTVWRDHEGMAAGSLLNDPHAVAIGDAQYQTWAANYGATLSQALTVPEPSGVLLALVGALLTGLRSKRSN